MDFYQLNIVQWIVLLIGLIDYMVNIVLGFEGNVRELGYQFKVNGEFLYVYMNRI